jgi:hypothetical protein
MADQKISALPAVTMPLAETEVLPIVQSATTKKVTVAELTTLIKHTMTMDNTNALQFGVGGVTASINYNGDGSLRIKPRAGYPLQIDQANIKISDAGYGIDFSANGGDVLSQYDEGTFTPAVAFNNLSTGVTYSTQTGAYTRIGRCVYFSIDIVLTSKGSATGNMTVTGLPFTSMATNAYGVSFADWYDFNFGAINPIYGKINPSNTNISMFREAAASYVQPISDAEVQNNTQFRMSGFYFV